MLRFGCIEMRSAMRSSPEYTVVVLSISNAAMIALPLLHFPVHGRF